jgi:hypothetical protein
VADGSNYPRGGAVLDLDFYVLGAVGRISRNRDLASKPFEQLRV